MDNTCLISWNVNGIRALYKKNFLTWLNNTKPDILCLQETKAKTSQLNNDLVIPDGYYTYWNSANQLGYSGTALFSREKPLFVEYGLGIKEFDHEGRVIIAQYPEFILINCYFPFAGRDHSRLEYKLAFYDAFFAKCENLKNQHPMVIFCGDLNTAHKEIDLARPTENRKKTGFLSEERAWIDKVIDSGYIDIFRYFSPDLINQYTWWSPRSNARERNVGWRIDYFFVSQELIQKVVRAFLLPNVYGSDHCPVGINLSLSINENTNKFINQK
ncbi:MAG TPA: exodeoxyribonuclease III [Flavobacterium sp.]|nr:exodeoxyribonuclease III [Flavobacterium sp.]